MKISLRFRWTPSGAYAFSMSVSIRKSYPCSGPYPMNVFFVAEARRRRRGTRQDRGRQRTRDVADPEADDLRGRFAAAKARTLRPISGKRYPAFNFR